MEYEDEFLDPNSANSAEFSSNSAVQSKLKPGKNSIWLDNALFASKAKINVNH